MKLYWYKDTANFGDGINPLIAMSLLPKGCMVEFSRPSHCEAVFIGSTLSLFLNRFSVGGLHGMLRKYLRGPVLVWGTGLINKNDDVINDKQGRRAQLIRRLSVSALRGKLTRDYLEELLGKDLGDIVLGDPGLLVDMLVKRPPSPEYALGIIPHYTEYANVRRMARYREIAASTPLSTIIDVRKDPIRVVSEIAACETILSTSLHGLIVADSFGIPNARCRPDNTVAGGDFKFQDYYSVYSTAVAADFGLDDLSMLNNIPQSIVKNYSVSRNEVQEIKRDLIAAFPIKGGTE